MSKIKSKLPYSVIFASENNENLELHREVRARFSMFEDAREYAEDIISMVIPSKYSYYVQVKGPRSKVLHFVEKCV